MVPAPDLITSMSRFFSHDKREKDYTVQTSLSKMKQTKKLFSVMSKGISWAKTSSCFEGDQLEQLKSTKSLMGKMTAPLIIPALVEKSMKLYKQISKLSHVKSLESNSKKSKKIRKIIILSASITCKSLKTLLWVNKTSGLSEKLSTSFTKIFSKKIKNFTTVVYPFLYIGKFIDTLESFSDLLKNGKNKKEQKKFLILKLAHQVTSVAIGIIDLLALVLGMIFSPMLMLSLSSFVLICKISKFFFKQSNEMKKTGDLSAVLCLPR